MGLRAEQAGEERADPLQIKTTITKSSGRRTESQNSRFRLATGTIVPLLRSDFYTSCTHLAHALMSFLISV